MKVLFFISVKIICYSIVVFYLPGILWRKYRYNFSTDVNDYPLIVEDSSWTNSTTLAPWEIVQEIIDMYRSNNKTIIVNNQEDNYISTKRMESGTDMTIKTYSKHCLSDIKFELIKDIKAETPNGIWHKDVFYYK